MAYTDRPGVSFWANYVGKPSQQVEPEWDLLRLPKRVKGRRDANMEMSQRRRLVRKFPQTREKMECSTSMKRISSAMESVTGVENCILVLTTRGGPGGNPGRYLSGFVRSS